ncbi:MAG: response regulator, partial [Streptomycetales bacterium]
MSLLVEPTATLVPRHAQRISAMVVAEDPRARAAMTRLLWLIGARDVVEAASAAEARRRALRPRDICVVDVHLPDGSGLALLAEMRRLGWTGGLALSGADDGYAVRAAFSAGVKGYLVTGHRASLRSHQAPNGTPYGALPPHAGQRTPATPRTGGVGNGLPRVSPRIAGRPIGAAAYPATAWAGERGQTVPG